MRGMDENPYQSPLAVDDPARKRKSFAPRVYWGDVIAWFAIGRVLAALLLPAGPHPQYRGRYVEFSVLVVWFLIGGLLVWFATRRGRPQR